MQDLFATDVLSDLNQQTLQQVQFVLLVVTVFKVVRHNHSVLLVGLVSFRELMTQLLASSARRATTVKGLVEAQLQHRFALRAHFVLKVPSIT